MSKRSVDLILQRAIGHHAVGELSQAEAMYRQVLAVIPDHIDAITRLGQLAVQVRRFDTAQTLLQRAIALAPHSADAHLQLGIMLHAEGKLEDAAESYERCIGIDDSNFLGLANLGTIRQLQKRNEDAVHAFTRAAALQPSNAARHYDLGKALESARQYEAAAAAFKRAITLRPDDVMAYMSLGAVQFANGDFDEAIEAYQKVIALQPNFTAAYMSLSSAESKVNSTSGEAFVHMRRALELNPNIPQEAYNNYLYTQYFRTDLDSQSIAETLQKWRRARADPLKKSIVRHSNEPSAARLLRIGYVSPDFRDHVVGRNFLPLLREHDRRQFQIFCYSNSDLKDAVTDQMQSLADVWRSIVDSDDAAAADQIRHDQIDILVDLSLHMAGNRILLFARKPAPVQVTFMGYPGSTGLKTIDYRLSDPYLDPPGLFDPWHSEQSIRLPETFWCYDPQAMELNDQPPSPLPALHNGFITFGCLNNFSKVNPEVLKFWAKVMLSVDRSRLLMLAPKGNARARTMKFFSDLGIYTDRIEFADPASRAIYLSYYQRIDLCLDTFPYNGHTTSLDGLWLGVPVVTLVGQTVVGRAGLSQLSNLGLQERLVAYNPEQFVETAQKLAGDLNGLAELRKTLRGRMLASPIMNAPRFARNVEAAYRKVWANSFAEKLAEK